MHFIDKLPAPVAGLARTTWDCAARLARSFDPRFRRMQAEISTLREPALARMCELAAGPTSPFEGTVLIDGTWYNPNYWWRLTLLRRALGTAGAREIGLLGRYQAAAARHAFGAMGISRTADFTKYREVSGELERQADALISGSKTPDDILDWRLPEQFPAACAYDAFLKNLRVAAVDPRDGRLRGNVVDLLASLAAARRLLDETRPSLVLLSSAINYECGSIAWVAAQRGIPVVVLYGCFGVPRFWKVLPGDGIFRPLDSISASDMDRLPVEKRDALAELGRRYIHTRLTGGTRDHGAIYAFGVSDQKVDRQAIAAQFGWDHRKPIVAVYAANWFDYPKSFGAVQFRDFLDWISFTLDLAAKNSDVNWIFRPHPCDEWYGGITLDDLVSDRGFENVRLSPKRWNGAAMIAAADAVVTMHGTAAIEYSCLGKPALIADRGWYDASGFAISTRDRQDYSRALTDCDWLRTDMRERSRRAEIFAGWFFGHPGWQAEFMTDDDFRKDELWGQFGRLSGAMPGELDMECRAIREWYESGAVHLHSFKMERAGAFAI